eukprot:COSAG05_NODE_23985_length_254_cov_1.000000_2_plen_26_part_01
MYINIWHRYLYAEMQSWRFNIERGVF